MDSEADTEEFAWEGDNTMGEVWACASALRNEGGIEFVDWQHVMVKCVSVLNQL